MLKRVFVVEDHPVFREALVQSLNQQEGFEVCGSSPNAEDALSVVPSSSADVALVDVSLPKMNGFEFAAEIRKRCPGLACLILSGYRSPAVLDRARALGLQGYVVKGDAHELMAALQDVLSGKPHFQDFS